MVTDGEWGALRLELENVSYDGATIFRNLNQVNRKGRTVVFTDGNKNVEEDFLSLDKEDVLINNVSSM